MADTQKAFVQGSSRKWQEEYYNRFEVYSQIKPNPSDVYTFDIVKTIENIFSVSVGGLVWILTITSLVNLFIISVWTVFFISPDINPLFVDRDFSTLMNIPNFLVSLIYVNIIRKNIVDSHKPLIDYYTTVVNIENVNHAYQTVFEYRIKTIKNFFTKRNRLIRSDEDFKEFNNELIDWYGSYSHFDTEMTMMLLLLSIFTLRVFIDKDDDRDYEDYGVGIDEIQHLVRIVRRNRVIKHYPKPTEIVFTLTSEIKRAFSFLPLELPIGKLPHISDIVLNDVFIEINRFKVSVEKPLVLLAAPEPRIFDIVQYLFIIMYFFICLPFIAFQAVTGFAPLFGFIVLFMLTLIPVVAWFVGSPLGRGHYVGPNFLKWRKRLYKLIDQYSKKRKAQMKMLHEIINKSIAARKNGASFKENAREIKEIIREDEKHNGTHFF